MKKDIVLDKNVETILRCGGVGVLPTDTLYGIVGSALKKETVERIYKLRKRNFKKPMIIFISGIKDLDLFGIEVQNFEKSLLKSIWPGKVSVVLACKKKKFEYLHRGQKTLALRVPEEIWLQKLLKKVGPLVAPSANFEGESPALTIKDAKKYFQEKVDFYVDKGKLKSAPSTLIKLEDGEMEILREGAVKFVL